MNACIALQDFATPMNRNQLNDTGMLNTVSSYMATNNSIWGGVPAMTATVAEVKANITRIDDKMGKQQTPTSGATDEKTQVRGDFEDQLLVIADQLSSLAAKNNDKNLGAQVDLNISTLDKLILIRFQDETNHGRVSAWQDHGGLILRLCSERS